jgi:hypothetical protein
MNTCSISLAFLTLQIDTPEALHYFTPENTSTPAAERDFSADEISVKMLSEQAKMAVNFTTIKQDNASGERFTGKTFPLEVQNHPHQLGLQWACCCGRFNNTKNRSRYLKDARNLAIDLNEAVHKPPPVVRPKRVIAPGVGPEYFLTSDTSPAMAQEERIGFLDSVKKSDICPLLFDSDDISSQWKRNWRSMDLKPGLELNQFAYRIFGDLKLPFPNMAMSCLLIYFRNAPNLEDCKLIRIMFGVDKNPEILKCRNCQPAFMAVDYIDCNGAMKVFIPLTPAGYERRFMHEHEYRKVFETRIGTICSSLVSLSTSYQGWSYMPTCYQDDSGQCCFEEDTEEWDPEGSSEQDKTFQPYPPDKEVHLCSNPRIRHFDEEKEEDEGF